MANGSKIHHPRIIQPGSWRRWWWLLGLLLALPLSVWLSLYYERWCPRPDMTAAQEEVASLRRQLEELEGDRAGLRQEVARLERSAQIDQEASNGLREEIKALQDERLRLEQEVIFLRKVVSSGTGKELLQIKDFKLTAKAEEAVFYYDFVVSQARERLVPMTGKILISLEGMQDSKVRTLSLKTLSGGKLEFVKMHFKRFQDVDGLIQLPKGFTPSRLRIDIQPDNEELPPLTKSYDWAIKG